MKILFVSAEVSPFAKVGGLADVAGSLPKALAEMGHEVRIIMPAYQMILDNEEHGVKKLRNGLSAKMNPRWSKPFTIHETKLGDVQVLLIETNQWFSDADKSEKVYGVGGDPYLFFSCAVLETMKALKWVPDVVHCNDWHTGLIPVLMREREPAKFQHTAAIFSIHNLAYQGEFGFHVLDQLELPHRLFNTHQLETYGGVNFLKAGCVYSDRVNTVSPRYAKEIQTSEFGCRLEGLMRHLAEDGRLEGILNGIDLDTFNPATDPDLSFHYSAKDMSGKAKCRTELLNEVGLEPIPGVPVAGMVTRLSEQKGLDMIIHAGDELLEEIQLVVLGSGDPVLARGLRELKSRHPNRVAIHEGFHLTLAPKIYAGSDMFLMPSLFEPCGLGQLIALRYGTIPVVRATGGLADTVNEGRNGFTFREKSSEALLDTVRRAKFMFECRDCWGRLMKTAMSGDYGWTTSAGHYVEMYERALTARPAQRKEA